MPRPFVLPDLGEGLQEAEIVKVLVAEGDVIAEDAPLLEVETDKAQVEIPSPFAGRVAKVHVQAGQSVRVGQVLVTFDDGRAAVSPATAPAAAPAPAARPAPAPRTAAPNGDHPATGPVPAAPSTRRLARELGVDLRTVHATGPAGRVTDDDVRAASAPARPASTPREAPGSRRA